jgi:uncharacterized membrane protein YjgN (DUF898 family)
MAEVAVDESTGIIGAAERERPSGGPALAYDGRVGTLFWLWLKVTLLSVVTLGFYRFWGRTRIRKYLWSRVTLDGERFEYDGTGGELFRRFLVTLVVLAPLIFGPQIAQLAGAAQKVLLVVQTAQAVILVFLAYLGYYTGRRYRLSRTVWSGIRGGLDGHSPLYALYAMLTALATLITLGLYSPWQRVILWRYEARHTAFGDGRFAFDGRGKHLFGAMLLSAALFIVALLAAAVLIVGALAVVGIVTRWFDGGKAVSFDNHNLSAILALITKGDWKAIFEKYAHFLIVFILGYFVLIYFLSFIAQAAFAVAFSRFHARWFNYLAERTRFNAVRLSSEVTAWPMFKLLFGNMLLQILTLGLARPFVAHRTLGFTCRHLAVHGIGSLRALRQSASRTKPPAEGLAQLLDSGGIA